MVRIIKNLLIVSFIVLAVIIFASCQNKNQQQVESSVIVLDMESLLSDQQEMTLSDIAESVRYIPLETNADVVCSISQYIIRGKRVFVRNKDETVFLFDDMGHFIRQIGQKGPGPNEYGGAQYMNVSPDGEHLYFYLTRQNKGYVYSVDGQKLSEFKIKYPTWRFAALSTDRHVMISPYGAFSQDSLPFLFYTVDGTGQVVKQFPSKKIIALGAGDFSIGKFMVTPKSVIGYHPFNDTVFSFDTEGNKAPKYVLNYGNMRVPNEEFDNMMTLYDNRHQYIHSTSLYECSGKIFIRAYHQKKTLIGFWQEEGNSVVAISSDDGKLLNDLDGGPDFWPAVSDGEKEVYRLVQALDMVESWNNGDFNEKEYVLTDERKEFVKMIQELKEEDNPIIMVVKLK
ncbi:MAG: 6-bladed beta-propeller [Bacteroidales bacterium]|nr:6-bladed beta-propeller [Bacteroidales bacterium]